MVLFLHCADDDDKPVLRRREEESGCRVKSCPLVVHKKPLWAPFLAPTNFTILSYGRHKRSILRTRRRTGTTWQALWYNRINSTDYSVAKDKTRDAIAQKLLREQKKNKKTKKSRTSSIEPVTCCTVCFVRRYINTLSRAGLHPQTPQTPQRQNGGNNWKTECFSS